jgi:type I restriction enzyme S subunit
MELIQQFDLLASSLGGVAKLRELILSLAVRGKLVPQNPADEPASVLLQKIRAEKERLIAEGKIKKDKPLRRSAMRKNRLNCRRGGSGCGFSTPPRSPNNPASSPKSMN